MRKIMPVPVRLRQIYEMKEKFILNGLTVYQDLEGDPTQDALFVFRLLTGNPYRDFLIEFAENDCGDFIPVRRADLILKPIWQYFEGLDLYQLFSTKEGKTYVGDLLADSRNSAKDICALLIYPYPKLPDHYKSFVDNFEVPVVYYYWNTLPDTTTT